MNRQEIRARLAGLKKASQKAISRLSVAQRKWLERGAIAAAFLCAGMLLCAAGFLR